MTETYLSVCDGIGGAAVAFDPLGWEASMLSEIEAWPCALLQQRHDAIPMNEWVTAPDLQKVDGGRIGTPLWGDFSAIRVRHMIKYGVALPSILIGGTPCQAFSVAGLRKSLDDARGNLTLSFVKLANAIDNARAVRGLPPLIIVWENVPGVLSTKDNAFGCFLGALVGDDAPLIPGGKQKWTNAGMVVGPRRKAAWIVKDAQYFRVAQRRRRVFLVASAREGFDPSEVLLEPNCMLRNPPSRDLARQDLAASLTASTGGVSKKDDIAGRVVLGSGVSGPELEGRTDAGGSRVEYVGNAEGGAISLPFLTTSNLGKHVNNQTPLVAVEDGEVYPILEAGARTGVSTTDVRAGMGVGGTDDAMFTLQAGKQHAVGGVFPVDALIGFQTRGSNLDVDGDVTGTIGSNCDRASGSAPMIAYSLSPGAGSDGLPSAVPTDLAPALTATGEAERNGRGLHVVMGFSTSGAGFWREGFGALRARAQDSHENLVVEAAPTLLGGSRKDGGYSHDNIPLVPEFAFKPSHFTRNKDGAPSDLYPPLSADADKGDQDPVVLASSIIPFDTTQITSAANYSQPKAGDACHPLAAGAHPPAIAFTCKDSGQDAAFDLSPTLRSMGFDGSHANGGGQVAVAFALRGREDGAVPEIEGEGDTVGTLRAANGGSSRDYVALAFDVKRGLAPHGSAVESEIVQSLAASDHKDPPLVRTGGDDVESFTVSNSSNGFAWTGEVTPTLDTTAGRMTNQMYGVRVEAAVRRLTPTECERLQGYEDGYTLIAWRGKPAEDCPDGPRYRALGNSWAIPCVKWVGSRIVGELERVGDVAKRPGLVWGDGAPFEFRLAA